MVDAGGRAYRSTKIGESFRYFNDSKTAIQNFTPKSELEVIDLDSLKLPPARFHRRKQAHSGTGWPICHPKCDQTEKMVFNGFEEVRFIYVPDLSSIWRAISLTPDALPGFEPEVLSAL